MFRWYQNAVVCYAFLSDVPSATDISGVESSFATSRWFTRGWTLQELIAPSNLIFFSADWHRLGTKSQLHNILSSITGIEKQFLNGEYLDLASAAKKMSWAASRKTSRVEDVAYSLLGILDINMPLIYGEGKKAFQRLQEEVLKTRPDDHTIFAWGTIVSTPTIKITDLSLYVSQQPVQRSQDAIHQPLLSLLAESPRDFASSGGFIPMPWVSAFYRSAAKPASFPLVIDRGVRLELPVIDAFDSTHLWDRPKIEQIRTAKSIALLCCLETDRNSFVKLPVQRWGNEYFGRSREMLIEDGSFNYRGDRLFKMTQTITVAAQRRVKLEIGDVILRRHAFPDSNHCEGHSSGYADVPNDDAVIEARKLRTSPKFGYVYSMSDLSRRHGFGIQFSRDVDAGEPGDSLLVDFFPVDLGDVNAPDEDELDGFGLRWWPDSKMKDVIPTHTHVMRTPLDVWKLDTKPFPPISVRVERMPFDGDGSCVDVLDIVVWPASNNKFRTLPSWAR